MNEKKYKRAIEQLQKFCQKNKDKIQHQYAIFQKFSNVFMKFEPSLTIQTLLPYFNSVIQTDKLISAIMNTDEEKRDNVVSYLVNK